MRIEARSKRRPCCISRPWRSGARSWEMNCSTRPECWRHWQLLTRSRSRARRQRRSINYQQALAIYRKTPEESGPNIALCSYNLALLYQEQKYFTEARALLEHALAAWQEQGGPEHAETKKARAKYEQLLQKMKETRAKRAQQLAEAGQGNHQEHQRTRIRNTRAILCAPLAKGLSHQV